jgi:hypothetical protein
MSTAEPDHAAVRPEAPTTYYDGVVQLPGYGDPPNRCRDYTPVGVCDHGHTVLGQSSCGTRYCPDHWRDWCEDAVVNAVARLAAYRQAVDGAERPASHVVASPPQDRRYSERALWETRSEAYDALADAGAFGGVMVTHPYRTNDRGDQLYQLAQEHGDVEEDTGKWAVLRGATEDHEDLSRYIEAAPHYHALVPTNYVDGEAAPDGWVVHRIREVQAFHIRDTQAYRDMASAVYYTLTHGAVQEGRQLTTYFGDVHPASFKPEEELTATEWDRIQREAEKAVKEAPGDDGPTHGPEECPRDDCAALVHDIAHLPDLLANDEWVTNIRTQPGGRRRLLRLRGAMAWWDGRTDRPPPGASTSKGRLLEWFEERGSVLTPEATQQSLPSVLGA